MKAKIKLDRLFDKIESLESLTKIVKKGVVSLSVSQPA
jgi:hypothetical protein